MRTSPTIAAAAIAAALGLACCAAPEEPAAADPAPSTSTSSATSAPTSTASAPTPAVQELDVDGVVDQVAATYWSSDTTKDDTPLDAARRAGEWLTPQARDLIVEDIPGGGGEAWLTLAEHEGKYIVTATDATEAMPDLPVDSETAASRGRILELRPVGAGGWTGEPTVLVAQFDLTRTDGAWLVDKITIDEPLTDPNNVGDVD